MTALTPEHRTRMFRGTTPDGRQVLVTLHDPEGYGEIAFRDDNRWGAPSELFEVE